jgi:triacylglycerol lipase
MHSIDFTKIVDRFERFVGDEVPTEASISLVGHSLGGLVARWYAQERDRERRVDRIVTLATPHAGTGLARFTPEVLRDALDPLGPTITQLRERRSTLSAVPHVNIVAGKDLLVRPRSSALALDDAATHELEGVGHNEILYFPKTARLVVDALR